MTTKANVHIKTKSRWAEKTANFFGSLGYLSVMIQWLMVFALYFTWIYTYFITPMQPTPKPIEVAPVSPAAPMIEGLSMTTMIMLGALVVVMVGVTIYSLIAIPKMASRAGSKVARTVASQAVPFALKVSHAPATKKNQIKMTARMLLIVKLAAVILPVVLAWASRFVDQQVLSVDMTLLVASLLVVPSSIFFILQYGIARIAKVPMKEVK